MLPVPSRIQTFYAYWTAASAATSFGLVPSAASSTWEAAEGAWFSFETAFPSATADVIDVLTPPVYLPHTWPGFAAHVGETIYDSYQDSH